VNFTLSKDSSDEEKFAEAKIMLDQRQAEELARVIPDQQAALAKSAHIQGTVTLDVTMEKNGEISTMRVLGGDERLAKALVEQTLRKAQQDSLATDLSERKMLLDELQRSQQGNQVEVSEKALAVARAQRAQADAQIAKLERAISEAKNGSNSESELKPVKTVAPEYPAQAKRDHVEGMVVVNVTVEQDGTVSSVEVVSGPAALTKAAVEAVKQWRFSEPRFAPVKTTVTLNFALDLGKN
jgi:TonB family protein